MYACRSSDQSSLSACFCDASIVFSNMEAMRELMIATQLLRWFPMHVATIESSSTSSFDGLVDRSDKLDSLRGALSTSGANPTCWMESLPIPPCTWADLIHALPKHTTPLIKERERELETETARANNSLSRVAMLAAAVEVNLLDAIWIRISAATVWSSALYLS